ncbi:MAG TPA: hypothetical protein VGB02_19885 [Pyrinomonadaceae bacterium]|jgi:uncharacterized membrane protein YphA (DoxX/SURF4 family)
MGNTIFNLAVIGIRIFLGFIFFTAGMGKLTHGHYFPLTMFPMSLSKILAPHGLSLWGEFVAWSQVLIGFLLMSQRFATIGAIMSLPLILNIFVITVSLGFMGTPYLNGFLIFLNLFLLAADYHKLKFLFMEDVSEFRHIRLRRNFWQVDLVWFAGLVLCLAAGAFHESNRAMTFTLSFAGIAVFLAGGVWQFFLQRKQNRTDEKRRDLQNDLVVGI